jgi:hypothetical protein
MIKGLYSKAQKAFFAILEKEYLKFSPTLEESWWSYCHVDCSIWQNECSGLTFTSGAGGCSFWTIRYWRWFLGLGRRKLLVRDVFSVVI